VAISEYSGDSRYILVTGDNPWTGAKEPPLKLVDAATGRAVAQFRPPAESGKGWFGPAVFLRDGRHVAAVWAEEETHNYTLLVWRLPDRLGIWLLREDEAQ